MKRLLLALAMGLVLDGAMPTCAQTMAKGDTAVVLQADSMALDSSTEVTPEALIGEEDMAALTAMAAEQTGLHQQLKAKFVEGSAGFMSLVAIALVLGLAFCIERIIYLTLSEINAKKLMADIDKKVESGDVEGAKTLCRDTRGPVASICYQGLLHIDEEMETVERSIVSYGAVQSANLEKGCSWITLFIAIAPSLGFLGTVIGMVMAFDQIQEAGDISPTIVASGMKVALITTIFGIIVALILQVFYNFILSKIEHLTSQMEESAITLLDTIMKYKLRRQPHA
jgi:biopolymer transport protein ExbB